MTKCPLCATAMLSSDAERAMSACRACANTIGIVPVPEARRPRVPCRHCNGMRFVHAIPREHSVSRQSTQQVSAPMYVTQDARARIGSSGADEIAVEQGHGLLEMYICLLCGFVEWYCHDAASIPIHPHLMTEIVDYGGTGPYR